MSQLFTSGGQSIRASVSASVLPLNIQGWFSSGLTGLISLQSKWLSRVFSSITIWKHLAPCFSHFSACDGDSAVSNRPKHGTVLYHVIKYNKLTWASERKYLGFSVRCYRNELFGQPNTSVRGASSKHKAQCCWASSMLTKQHYVLNKVSLSRNLHKTPYKGGFMCLSIC